MSRPTFTLIIPTRNRQRTAVFAIESAINCRDSDLQIIVCDNSDNDLLKSEISRRGWLQKLLYLKTESVLSMRDNWEFALDHSEGDFVTVIGDDDAVMPDCFAWARNTFSRVDVEVLQPKHAIYKWDDYPFHGRRQYLACSFGERIFKNSKPRDFLRKGIEYKVTLGTGPGIYYGFVRRDFLISLKNRRGRWLCDPVPDLDSGYATLMYSDAYATAERNVFVSGHSGPSNSGAIRSYNKLRENLKTFSEEAEMNADNVLLSDFPKLQANEAIIVSGQMRLLPEIRNVLDDQQLEVNLIGAWQFISDSLAQSYETLSWSESKSALKALSEKWGISDKVALPERRSLCAGVMREQGPRSLSNDTSSATVSAKFDRIVVNGNRLNFKSIIDAVNFIQSVLPPLIRVDGSNQRILSSQDEDERIKEIMSLAAFRVSRDELTEALEEILPVLIDHPHNVGLLCRAIDIYVKQNRMQLARELTEQLLSITKNEKVVERYSQILVNYGQSFT